MDPKVEEKRYGLINGTEVTLDELCRAEPRWAANRLRYMYRSFNQIAGLLDGVTMFDGKDPTVDAKIRIIIKKSVPSFENDTRETI